jgi:hypothetical protein
MSCTAWYRSFELSAAAVERCSKNVAEPFAMRPMLLADAPSK